MPRWRSFPLLVQIALVIEMEFEGEGIDVLAPGASTPGQPQPDNDKDKASGKPQPDAKCKVCLQEKAIPRQCYCTQCKKDVQACQADAIQSGRKAFYEEQCKTEAAFRKMVLAYQRDCKSRGQGRRRDKMNWGRFQDILFREKTTASGTHRQTKHYEAWEKYYTGEGYSVQEAFAEWNKSPFADNAGPNGSERRHVPMYMFFAAMVESGSRAESVTGTKDIHATSGGVLKGIDVLDKDVLARSTAPGGGASVPAPVSGSASGPASGSSAAGSAAGSAAETGDPPPPPPDDRPPKKRKDLARVRLGFYDRAMSALRQLEESCKVAATQGREHLKQLEQRDDRDAFKHYSEVLNVRVLGLEALVHKGGVDEVNKFEALYREQLKDTPIATWSTVRCLHDIQTKHSDIRVAETCEDAQKQWEALQADMNIIASMRTAVAASVRDLCSAIKQAALKQERGRERQRPGTEKQGKPERQKAVGGRTAGGVVKRQDGGDA